MGRAAARCDKGGRRKELPETARVGESRLCTVWSALGRTVACDRTCVLYEGPTELCCFERSNVDLRDRDVARVCLEVRAAAEELIRRWDGDAR
jgi:hypothetical protein